MLSTSLLVFPTVWHRFEVSISPSVQVRNVAEEATMNETGCPRLVLRGPWNENPVESHSNDDVASMERSEPFLLSGTLM